MPLLVHHHIPVVSILHLQEVGEDRVARHALHKFLLSCPKIGAACPVLFYKVISETGEVGVAALEGMEGHLGQGGENKDRFQVLMWTPLESFIVLWIQLKI